MTPRRLLAVLVLAVGVIAPALFLGTASGDTADAQMTATWNCCGDGGAAAQDFLISASGGSLSGTARLPDGQTFARISGSRAGDAVTIVTTYTALRPGYVATFVGTLAPGASSISGSWSDTLGQRGTFTATRAAPFMDPLPVPEASKRVSRIQSLVRQKGTGPAGGTVVRDGKTYPLASDSILQVGDVVHTDANSVATIEFLISGRVGLNSNATVRIDGDRSVSDLSTGTRTVPSRPSMWIRPTNPTQPLDIRTNAASLAVRG